ncbi:uncharacterized protein EI90DRAFT_3117266 [Cantharellus anzutake]|uniref:uncharacterized protein n=1 Tax=Cantharellus anzutake TaxID=1750568 RepID=UPI0019073F82|nr:uncharacterized protein EI90DRAFT_3117266 [Cantharellus anzutake]KAF8340720.1 hypothetical protein EI90DRAFT_3117266 [Cantharellus anzutake]
MTLEQKNEGPTDLNSPYLALEEQVHPHEHAELFGKEIKHQCKMRKNSGWENSPDEFTHLKSLFSPSFPHCIIIKVLSRA